MGKGRLKSRETHAVDGGNKRKTTGKGRLKSRETKRHTRGANPSLLSESPVFYPSTTPTTFLTQQFPLTYHSLNLIQLRFSPVRYTNTPKGAFFVASDAEGH